jgi:hypothetical protein
VTEESTTINNEKGSSVIEVGLVIVIWTEKQFPPLTDTESSGNSIINPAFVFENEPNFTTIRRSTELPVASATFCHEYAIPWSDVSHTDAV